MPACSVYLSRLRACLLPFLHTRFRVHPASGIPCALLISRDTRRSITRAIRAARMRSCVPLSDGWTRRTSPALFPDAAQRVAVRCRSGAHPSIDCKTGSRLCGAPLRAAPRPGQREISNIPPRGKNAHQPRNHRPSLPASPLLSSAHKKGRNACRDPRKTPASPARSRLFPAAARPATASAMAGRRRSCWRDQAPK